ncbi:hypothetical protein GCM10023075_09450 [Streptosporangium album]
MEQPREEKPIIRSEHGPGHLPLRYHQLMPQHQDSAPAGCTAVLRGDMKVAERLLVASHPHRARPDHAGAIASSLHISIERDYALGSPEVDHMEVPMRKMTIRRKSALRLLSGARRLWIEWCW